MKPLQKRTVLRLLIFSFIIVFTHCKKDSGEAVKIDGFDITDNIGNVIAHVGPADNDWTFNNILTTSELALFDFQSPFNLEHTTQATISNKVMAYPNPAAMTQSFYVTATDSVLLKLVVVNKELKVLTKGALKFKGPLTIQLDYTPDIASFPSGSSLRVYYSFSAMSKQNFKTGYGDIKMCYGSGGSPNNYQDCF